MRKNSVLAISAATILVNTLVFALTFDSNSFQNASSHSYASVTSTPHAFSQRVLFGVFAALFTQLILDNCGKLFLRRKLEKTLPAQATLQLAILVPSMAYLIGEPNVNFAAFYWPLLHMQIVLVVHVALCFWAHRMDKKTSVLDVYSNSLFNTITFSLHIYMKTPAWDTTQIEVIGFMYRLFFIFSCLSISALLGRSLINHISSKSTPTTVNERWALVAAALILIFYIGFLSLELTFPHDNYGTKLQIDYIVASNYWLGLFAFVLNSLIDRKDRREGIMSEIQLEIKRLFVRYVSHEIRTPLNTTLLGLNLLSKEVKAENGNPDALCEMISDATDSCNIAIDILSDLLLYEKIDGGLLSLNKSEIAMWPFVKEVLRMFLIQAKSARVDMSWPAKCVPGVFCEVDKYKLSQVIRNLVSNALKFTPSNGRVRISASVVTGPEPPPAHEHTLKPRSGRRVAAIALTPTGATAASVVADLTTTVVTLNEREGMLGIACIDTSLNSAQEGDEGSSGKYSQKSNPSLELFKRRYPGEMSPKRPPRSIQSNASELRFTAADNDANSSQKSIQSAQSPAASVIGSPYGNMPEIVFGSDDGLSPSLRAVNSESSLPEMHKLYEDPGTSDGGGGSNSSPKKSSAEKRFSRDTFSSLGAHIIRVLSTDTAESNKPRKPSRIFPKTTWVRITVTDSGAGISKTNQTLLFKEIVQFNADKLQKGQGSGIGLWISNSIVKLHNGRIGVVSEGEGAGSTFYIDIPVSRINSSTDQTPENVLNSSESVSPIDSPASASTSAPGSPIAAATDGMISPPHTSPSQVTRRSRKRVATGANALSNVPSMKRADVAKEQSKATVGGEVIQSVVEGFDQNSDSESQSSSKTSVPQQSSCSSVLKSAGVLPPNLAIDTRSNTSTRVQQQQQQQQQHQQQQQNYQQRKSEREQCEMDETMPKCRKSRSHSSLSTIVGSVYDVTRSGNFIRTSSSISTKDMNMFDGRPYQSHSSSFSSSNFCSRSASYGNVLSATTTATDATADPMSSSSPKHGVIFQSAALLYPQVELGVRKFIPNKRDSIQEYPIEEIDFSDSTVFDDAEENIEGKRTIDFGTAAGIVGTSASTTAGSGAFAATRDNSAAGSATAGATAEAYYIADDEVSEEELRAIHRDSVKLYPSAEAEEVDDGVFNAVSSSSSSSSSSNRSNRLGDSAFEQARINAERNTRLFDKKVLIVDDSKLNRKFVNRLLKHKIAHREEAFNGQEAVAMCLLSMREGKPFDLLLLDYSMPEMDGPTAARIIRDSGFRGAIIGVTGHADDVTLNNFLSSGVDRVVVKPINADDLQDTITELLLRSD